MKWIPSTHFTQLFIVRKYLWAHWKNIMFESTTDNLHIFDKQSEHDLCVILQLLKSIPGFNSPAKYLIRVKTHVYLIVVFSVRPQRVLLCLCQSKMAGLWRGNPNARLAWHADLLACACCWTILCQYKTRGILSTHYLSKYNAHTNLAKGEDRPFHSRTRLFKPLEGVRGINNSIQNDDICCNFVQFNRLVELCRYYLSNIDSTSPPRARLLLISWRI